MERELVVKMVVEKLREDGGIGWWEEYVVLRRKFELDNEGGPVGKLKLRLRPEMRRTGKKLYIRKEH